MKNYVQHGDTIALTAPVGGVVGGVAYLIGSIFGVAAHSADAAASFEHRVKGVFSLPRVTGGGTAWVEGDPLYWDDTAKKLTKTAADNRRVAIAVAAAADADTEGKAVLVPSAGIAPSAALADLVAIAGGESPTEAEHNAVITRVNAIAAVLRAHNLLAD